MRSSSISTCPKRLFPVIESLTGQGIDVSHACRVLGVSQSGYYDWKTRPLSPRALRRIWLAGEIADVHKASAGTYGALRVTAELRHGRQIVVGHNAVESIMRQLGIKGLPTRRLPKGARVGKVTSLDLVRREFRRTGLNQLWMTDITEHPTREGKLYCCVVLDAFSRMVVGWAIDSTQTTTLVLNALGMATRRRVPAGELVIHSDRGVQFTSWAFSQSVRDAPPDSRTPTPRNQGQIKVSAKPGELQFLAPAAVALAPSLATGPKRCAIRPCCILWRRWRKSHRSPASFRCRSCRRCGGSARPRSRRSARRFLRAIGGRTTRSRLC